MAYRKLTWVHDNYPSIGCNNSLGKEEKMVLNYKKLGKKIKEFRLTNGLSQEQLAEACNLSTSYISYIETGKKKINFSKLEKIARILDFVIDIQPKNTENFDFKELTINSSNREKEFLYKVMRHIKTELETYNFD